MGPSAVKLSCKPIWNALRETLMMPADAVIQASRVPIDNSAPPTTTAQQSIARESPSLAGCADVVVGATETDGVGVDWAGSLGVVVTGGGSGRSVHSVPLK